MSIEEAIGHLKNIKIYSFQDGYTDEVREALDIAIEALEKKIPKRPVQDKKNPRYGHGYEYYDYICPTCGRFLCFEPQFDDFKRKGTTICKCCGQLISWENGCEVIKEDSGIKGVTFHCV